MSLYLFIHPLIYMYVHSLNHYTIVHPLVTRLGDRTVYVLLVASYYLFLPPLFLPMFAFQSSHHLNFFSNLRYHFIRDYIIFFSFFRFIYQLVNLYMYKTNYLPSYLVLLHICKNPSIELS